MATGTIHSYWDSEDESIIRRIYTDQKYHGLGFERKIIETLEKDEIFTRAKRIEIPASLTALDFYRKLGYNFKDGKNKVDDEGHYRLEKFNKLVKNKSK